MIPPSSAGISMSGELPSLPKEADKLHDKCSSIWWRHARLLYISCDERGDAYPVGDGSWDAAGIETCVKMRAIQYLSSRIASPTLGVAMGRMGIQEA